MSKTDFIYTVKNIRFDENYKPGGSTRITTNFANLARGAQRKKNLQRTLSMINERFNKLAYWDNPEGNRYSLVVDIVSVELQVKPDESPFPAIELLRTTIEDSQTGKFISGIVGNNFSSYVRDYDFSVVLPQHNEGANAFSVPDDFGELHGKLFHRFLHSEAYRQHFNKMPVICLSVSDAKIYKTTGLFHPVLGNEYRPDDTSLTEHYFKQMGLDVRYFMPPGAVAPLAFFYCGDLLNDYSSLELISTISTMETFQKIYRPEIYAASEPAGDQYRPSLSHSDFEPTNIVYDRAERNQLAKSQGEYAEAHLIKPYGQLLSRWSAGYAISNF